MSKETTVARRRKSGRGRVHDSRWRRPRREHRRPGDGLTPRVPNVAQLDRVQAMTDISSFGSMTTAPDHLCPKPMSIERARTSCASFAAIRGDTVFSVEYSVRAAQTAVYTLLEIDRPIPAITPYDQSVLAWSEAIVKALE